MLLLARPGARLNGPDGEAEEVFTETTGLGRPLDLYAKELDPKTQEHLGNYPQALTHAALVQAALALNGD